MRKEVLVVLLIAIALAVAGCKGGGGKSAVSSSSTPFIGGTEAVRIAFLDNAPPKETLDNPQPATKTEISKFDVVLRVENVGEQDIPGNTLKVTIGGIYPNDFNVPNSKTAKLEDTLPVDKRDAAAAARYVLPGVKKDPEGAKITGGLDEVSFVDLAYTKSLEGNNDFPIQADVCYPYKTRAVADFCMRNDLTRTISGVCDIKGSKPVFSSGGPVQVASFEEAVGGQKKVILKFKIKASGTGTFYKPDSTWPAKGNPSTPATCRRGDFQTEDFVRVSVDSGILGLSCSGWGGALTKDVRLTSGEAAVTCIQSGVEVDAIQKFNIVLEYNHRITASTKILVKHLPTDNPAGGVAAAARCAAGATRSGCTTAQGCPGLESCGSTGVWICNDVPNDGCPSPTSTASCTPGQTLPCTTTQNCPGTQNCLSSGSFGGPCNDRAGDNCPAPAQGTGSAGSGDAPPPAPIRREG